MNEDRFYELAIQAIIGKASEDEKGELELYLKIAIYQKAYSKLKNTLEDPKSYSDEFSLERGLSLLRTKISQTDKTKIVRIHFLNKMKRIAASIAIVLSVGFGYYFLNKLNEDASVTNNVVFKNPEGQRNKVVLPDGTLVYLNGGASISYPENFDGESREVVLTGEAFFNVKRNEQKPFVVCSGIFQTKVLGTSFNIKYKEDTSMVVTVETGKVRVSGNCITNGVTLVKGNQAIYNKENSEFIKAEVDAWDFTDWHRNILRFNEIPAEEVFKNIEKWYNVKIHCKSNQILKRKIRASYINESLEKVLNSLQFMVGFEYVIQNDTITIK